MTDRYPPSGERVTPSFTRQSKGRGHKEKLKGTGEQGKRVREREVSEARAKRQDRGRNLQVWKSKGRGERGGRYQRLEQRGRTEGEFYRNRRPRKEGDLRETYQNLEQRKKT